MITECITASSMSATYSPEDNKLRLYTTSRLPADLYERLKAAGFKWAPKQELYVAPAWTPSREDLLVELCGEIGDEDTSLVERAEDRAERFGEYSDKRAYEAEQAHSAVSAISDQIPLGQPILIGHHSERRARKDAEKIENGMRRAVKAWETSEYWKYRAAGAIRHAKYKALPAVRARRIKTLEADKRKHERNKKESESYLKAWTKEGLTVEEATTLANYGYTGEIKLKDGTTVWSGWSAIVDGKATFEEVRDQVIPRFIASIRYNERCISHLDNRLAYEREMLAAEGGIASDRTKPEKGGAVRCWASQGGWALIQKVNRISVTILDNWGNGGPNFTRTIPFDDIKAIMTKSQVDEARESGRLLNETDRGFIVADPVPEAAKPLPKPEPSKFEVLRDSLRDGIKIVSAPQLFETPAAIADEVVRLAAPGSSDTILEPSAGTGRLIAAILRWNNCAIISAVEINLALADGLRTRYGKGDNNISIRCSDFLACDDLGQFDRIVMNPPFENASDIKHIQHARKFLKPGGRLVAICANGPRQREKLMPDASQWIDLEPGAFAESGTNVNSAILVIDA